MKYLKQLNKILTIKQKKTFIFLACLTFVSMTLEIITLNAMLGLLNYMTNPSILYNSKFFTYFNNINYDFSLIFIALFVSAFVLKTLFNIFISWKEQRFMAFTLASLSKNFFKGYLYLPRIFHLRSNTADLIKNITIEVDIIITAIHSLSILIMETIVLLGISVFLMFVNLKLTIICFLLLTVFSFVLSFFNAKKIMQMGKDRAKLTHLRLKSIIEGLSGSKVFELTGSQENQLADFNKHNNKFAEISSNVDFRNTLPRPLFELFIFLVTGFIVVFILRDKSEITGMLPILGVFLAAAYRLIPSFARILENLQRFQFTIQAAERLSRDMEKFQSIKVATSGSTTKEIFKSSIKFENVSFSYNKNLKIESNLVLKNVNFTINKGSKIGIIGPSGSGKSTFLDLIMGLILPQDGRILIDDKNIKEKKSGWQKIIGCVPQEVFILDNTLKRNVAFGLPDHLIDENKVLKAIELANLKEFIDNSKLGLERLLGEDGSRLSGGQRQRIGIARALYNQPNILILDEATNALDEQTEKKIIKEIFQNKEEDKTIIFVSHNIKNLSFCETIFSLKDKNLSKLS